MTIEALVEELETLLQRLDEAGISDESKLELGGSYLRLTQQLSSEPSLAQEALDRAGDVSESELRQLIDNLANELSNEPLRIDLTRQIIISIHSIVGALSEQSNKDALLGRGETAIALCVFRRLDDRKESVSVDSPLSLELHNRRRDALHEVLDKSVIWKVREKSDWGKTDDKDAHELVTVRVEIVGEANPEAVQTPALQQTAKILSQFFESAMARAAAELIGRLAQEQERQRILDFKLLKGGYSVRCDPEDYGRNITVSAISEPYKRLYKRLSIPFPVDERMAGAGATALAFDTVSRGGTLGEEVREGKGPLEPAPSSTMPVEAEPDQHYVNVEIVDHDKNKPLQLGQEYTLSIDADVVMRDTALATSELPLPFKESEDVIEITVHVDSKDFKVHTKGPQTLRVPRKGKSRNKARFDIEPRHVGECLLTAVLLKDGNFIHAIPIKLQVGGAGSTAVLSSETIGRPLDSTTLLEPRDVNLHLYENDTGFRAVLTAGNSFAAEIAINKMALDQMISQARKALKSVVYMKDNVYQKQLTIPPDIAQDALQAVAQEGFRLYQRLFFGPNASMDSQNLGQILRDLSQGEDTLKIQITSGHFLLPWNMLYMANEFNDRDIKPELFLGMRHIVEHILVKKSQKKVPPRTIDSRNRLKVSLNVNAGIDQEMGQPFVASQRKAWESIQAQEKATVVVRQTEMEVLEALKATSTPDQILYFLCHATSQSLSEGPDGSTLVLTSKANGLALGHLSIYAPTTTVFPNAPLIFINACESAELSPLLYDGFVPYFMDKGARGVIGTECDVPALLAVDWAKRFFEEFLNGKPLGQVMLDLRQEFYAKHNNILGLLYALYCDGDTRVDPSLQLIPTV